MKILASFGVFAFSMTLLVGQSEWMNWRGPNGNGSFAKGSLPMEFDGEGKNVVWKTELPGRGCSTPIAAKGYLFLTAPIEGKDSLLAFDMKGQKKWSQSYGKETPGRGQRVGSGANSSAVTDGETVVGYFKSGRVAACSLDGKKLWDHNLHEKYGKDTLWWDQGTSPVIAGESVIIAVMQTEGNSYLVSFDLKTGKENWKTERKFETGKESGDSYTTPHVVRNNGVEMVVSFGADHLTGHDVKTGKELWKAGGQNPEKKKMWRTIASSVETDGVIVVPYGRGDFLLGLKTGDKGDITESHTLWKKKTPTTDAASPVAMGGLVYVLIDRGRHRGKLNCLNAKTGELLWEDRLPKSASTFYASPILIGGTLCCPREDGAVFMAKLTKDGLKDVKENALGEGVIASPISVDGHLIIRGDKHLWCFK